MTDHPHAIPLTDGATLTAESHEIMRVWITNGAGSSVWIDARVLEDPAVFGYLMADTVRHAARAYAGTWAGDERTMLEAIVNAMSAELREQLSEITTIRQGRLD